MPSPGGSMPGGGPMPPRPGPGRKKPGGALGPGPPPNPCRGPLPRPPRPPPPPPPPRPPPPPLLRKGTGGGAAWADGQRGQRASAADHQVTQALPPRPPLIKETPASRQDRPAEPVHGRACRAHAGGTVTETRRRTSLAAGVAGGGQGAPCREQRRLQRLRLLRQGGGVALELWRKAWITNEAKREGRKVRRRRQEGGAADAPRRGWATPPASAARQQALLSPAAVASFFSLPRPSLPQPRSSPA